MLGMAPAGVLVVPDPFSGGGEGQHAVSAVLLGQRVTGGPGELAVGEGLFAGFFERNEREAAESEVAALAADDEPLDPTPRSSGSDQEI